MAAFAVGMRWDGVDGAGLRHAVTVAFMTLALAQVAHAFNTRSRTRSAFTSRLFTNAWLWGATLAPVVIVELVKFVARWHARTKSTSQVPSDSSS